MLLNLPCTCNSPSSIFLLVTPIKTHWSTKMDLVQPFSWSVKHSLSCVNSHVYCVFLGKVYHTTARNLTSSSLSLQSATLGWQEYTAMSGRLTHVILLLFCFNNCLYSLMGYKTSYQTDFVWGRSDGSVDKSTFCFYRGSEFSQHPHLAASSAL